jgi:hypothetical protein
MGVGYPAAHQNHHLQKALLSVLGVEFDLLVVVVCSLPSVVVAMH